jgi:hypothetical protein
MQQEKKLYFTIGLFIILTCLSLQLTFAQEPNEDPNNRPVPKIKLFEETINFGKVDGGTTVNAEIKFTNEGNAPLEITKVRPSCGCMAGKLKKKIYEPGESGAIDLSYQTKNRKGLTKGYVLISSNDPEQSQARVNLKANIIQLIEIEPRILTFLDIDKNVSVTQKIHVTTKKPLLIEASLLKPTQENIEMEITPKQQTITEKGADFNVTIKPSASGRFTNSIILKSEKDLERPIELKTSIMADVTDVVIPSPKNLLFMINKKKQNRRLQLTNKDDVNEPITIEQLDYDKELFDIKVNPTDKKGVIELVISPKMKALGDKTNLTSNIKIKANAKNESAELLIPARFYQRRTKSHKRSRTKKPSQKPKTQQTQQQKSQQTKQPEPPTNEPAATAPKSTQ